MRDLEAQVNGPETAIGTVPQSKGLPVLREKEWEGVWIRGPGGSQPQLYGPLSSSFFIYRMNSFLGVSLQRWSPEQHLIPSTTNKVFASPEMPTGTHGGSHGFLSQEQESYFLRLFWQTFQVTVPILNEAGFKDHHESLWKTETHARPASPIIDIVVALCIQYGMGLVPGKPGDGSAKSDIEINDSSIAGRQYYRRCQSHLALELERPSISTVQCHIYSSLYLHNASFVNMAYTTLAAAVRIAHTLGLHHEPSETLPAAERHLRRRIWWAISALDAKMSLSLGAPALTRTSSMSCRLPVASAGEHKLSRSQLVSPKPDITWLSYHDLCIKMVHAAQNVSIKLQEKGSKLITMHGDGIYSNPRLLEELAGTLTQTASWAQEWIKSVPDSLRNERESGAKSFSPGETTLVLDHRLPSWLQLQRILLELRYHDLVLNIYRPFVRFSAPDGATPLADSHATTCLSHAISNTFIIHQVLTETNILHGWHEIYKIQWNSAISIAGFCFSYPISPGTLAARKALDTTVEVFRIMAGSVAIATSAAKVVHDLAQKIDIIAQRLQTGLSTIPDQGFGEISDGSYAAYADGNAQVSAASNTIGEDTWSGGPQFHFPFESFVDLDTLMYDGSSINVWQDFLSM